MNLQKIFLDSPSATTSLSSQQEYEIHIHDTAEDDAWDAFLAHTPGSHYFQTSRWAKVKSLAGWQAIRLIVTKARRIVGGMQMLLRPLPWGGQIGYIPKGFVLAEAEPHLAELLLGQMQQLARAYRVQYLVAQPPRQGQILAQQLAAAGFRPNLRMGTIASTLLVDLSPDPETLLAQMQKSTRMNIRRGEKRGIQVREGDAADLPLFYHLLETAARRKHFTVFSAKYYRELWQALAPAGFLKMFIAEYEGEAVTAMLAIPFGDTMYSHISAWSGSHAERKPNETLEWHAMMWAKSHDYRYYDFEGINREAAQTFLNEGHWPLNFDSHKDRTVTQYKLGFGGQIVLLPEAYEYVFNPLLRWLYFEMYPQMQRLAWVAKIQKQLMRRSQPRV